MQRAEFETTFKALRELGEKTFNLRGTTVLVEMLPEEELKTKQGLILVTQSNQKQGGINAHKLEYGQVLMVGQGTWDDEKREYVPLDIKVGQVVVMPQYSSQILSTWPGLQRPLNNKLALINAASVFGSYTDYEEFMKASEVMNSAP